MAIPVVLVVMSSSSTIRSSCCPAPRRRFGQCASETKPKGRLSECPPLNCDSTSVLRDDPQVDVIAAGLMLPDDQQDTVKQIEVALGVAGLANREPHGRCPICRVLYQR